MRSNVSTIFGMLMLSFGAYAYGDCGISETIDKNGKFEAIKYIDSIIDFSSCTTAELDQALEFHKDLSKQTVAFILLEKAQRNIDEAIHLSRDAQKLNP